MTADRHRRDAHASAGARISHRTTQRSRTGTQDLAPTTGSRAGRRSPRRRQRSSLPTLLLAIGLILGFVAICVLLLERNQDRFDPFTTIEAQLRSEAPETFASEQLDGSGERLVQERLDQGHHQWFAGARQAYGEQQRRVMAGYWDRAARALAADPAIQDAYRRAGLSFVFRGQWFGKNGAAAADPEAEASTAPTPAAPAEPVPAAPRRRPEADEAEAAPEPEPEPPGAIERLM